MLWNEHPVHRVGQRWKTQCKQVITQWDGNLRCVRSLCWVLNWDVRFFTCYNIWLFLFSYLTFSSLFSSNCSCFHLTWRLLFSTEERCYLKEKRNYWGALGLRQRRSTVFSRLHNNLSHPTSSLCTVSSVERAIECREIYIHTLYIYIYKYKILVLVCGLLFHGFLLSGGVYTA